MKCITEFHPVPYPQFHDITLTQSKASSIIDSHCGVAFFSLSQDKKCKGTPILDMSIGAGVAPKS